jgi:hypothetical protein
MALALGLINLLTIHGGKVLFKRKGFVTSFMLLAGLILMIFASSYDWNKTIEISKETQKFLILKEFSERIEADHKAGITPIGNYKSEKKQLQYFERNQILIEETNKQINESEQTVHAGIVTWAEGDPNKFIYQKALSDFSDAVSAARKALPTLTVENVAEPNFEPNQILSKALSSCSVAYRGMLTARYSQEFGKRFYNVLFDGFYVSLGAAMFALLGFYIAAAAYRAFRLRSIESCLMMSAALIVMLGQIPFGLWISEQLPMLRLWLLQVPSAGASRAIEFGASLAGLVMAFRMWLSIESESFEK